MAEEFEIDPVLQGAVERLFARYVHCIDDDRLEEWPAFFTEKCLYKITSADNYAAGLPVALFYADSQAMLRDRISALRDANIYEAQRYRHVVSSVLVTGQNGPHLIVQSNFQVIRTMQDGAMALFATGRYLDRVVVEPGGLLFEQRLVICDSQRIDTLLAIPI
jgi:3-phenylpropionate/cinnamic acid dioxygenase small subunit